ncbi:MAG: hypothetical protein IT373_02565 [Polyangiaceae bacterium]|nr:hypothetical protein [Polyangiaceae bacterium]
MRGEVAREVAPQAPRAGGRPPTRRRPAPVPRRFAPPGTTLAVGDAAPEPARERLEVDPGTVTITATTPDGALEPETVNLRDGEERTLDLARLEPVPIVPPQPVALAARSLLLPDGTVALAAWAFHSNLGWSGTSPDDPTCTDDGLCVALPGFTLAARGAVADGLELDGVETFTMGFIPGDLVLGVRGRLVSGDVELALRGAGRIPLFFARVGGGYVSLRAAGSIAGWLRLEGALGLGVVKALDDRPFRTVAVGLFEPVGIASGWYLPMAPGLAFAATVSPIAYLHLGLETGFGIQDFTVASSSFVPLGFRVGGVVPSREAPVTDIDLRFALPYCFMPVAGNERWLPRHDERAVVSDWWSVTLGAQGYIYP